LDSLILPVFYSDYKQDI